MRIESLSIRAVTVGIFLMIAVVAVILSLFAGSYFRQSALNAQMSSLSRVIEVASQEALKEARQRTFGLGMRFSQSSEIVQAVKNIRQPGGTARLVALLDDPFINGFVGFDHVQLEKIRVYDLDLKFLAESSRGLTGLESRLAAPLVQTMAQRTGIERLKGLDTLWISTAGPLHSTLVPLGGLRPAGYLEIIANPAFNLPNIGKITRTPISIFSMTGETLLTAQAGNQDGHLPIEYILHTPTGEAAFRIVGYEDVKTLNAEMDRTRIVTVSGFLALTFGTLLLALWLFNRFLFAPVGRMVGDMQRMAEGRLDLTVDKKGLRDFTVLAEALNSMANQVRLRTNDLERLLDLDDSAILCFGGRQEVAYFNRGATNLFGYAGDETSDLDMRDLFTDDIDAMMAESERVDTPTRTKLHTRLKCLHKDGSVFESDAVIRPLDVKGGRGFAIVLHRVQDPGVMRNMRRRATDMPLQNEQRIHAVEQSLDSLLELARNSPGLMPESSPIERLGSGDVPAGSEYSALREQTVHTMHAALACWEHDLGKGKLDLAEQSGIWPVYIDKSTPTTRTLDKYLHLEVCPQHPRAQRVIATAEFVLKHASRKTAQRKKLQEALSDFRRLVSGVKPAAK